MKKKVRIGLVGCGGIGRTHLNAFMYLSEQAEVVATADIIPERARTYAAEVNANWYASAEEMVRSEELDMIDICVPTIDHAKLALLGMDHGLHVFIEKPLCLTAAEGEALIAKQQATGLKVMVGQLLRFWTEYRYVHDRYVAGDFGRLLSASLSRTGSAPVWAEWYMDPDRSGTLGLDLHIHDIDFVRFMLGEPEEIYSRGNYYPEPTLKNLFTILQYPDLAIGIEAAWHHNSAFPFSMKFRLGFEKALLTYDSSVTPSFLIYEGDAQPYTPEIPDRLEFPPSKDGSMTQSSGHILELGYFLDCIQNDKVVEQNTLADAFKSVTTCLEIIRQCGGAKK
ncbi:MAG: Gfo/Idh/MocA family oxidoreductase [Clostridiaceae bacterium]|nr:Gfo/Idh/MocA family oxidoreductase [Clostridiaceae bacterium]